VEKYFPISLIPTGDERSHIFQTLDSAPAPCFKTPAPTMTPKSFETSTPTPVKTQKTSKFEYVKISGYNKCRKIKSMQYVLVHLQ